MIAFFDAGHAGSDVYNDAGAFVTEDRRKQSLRVIARTGELVGMADAGRPDLDQDLARARPVQIDGMDFQRFAGGGGDGGAGLHGEILGCGVTGDSPAC